MFSSPLVLIDCEMTGPDPVEHQLLEISALRCDPKNYGIVDKFCTNVGVAPGSTVEEVMSKAHPGAIKKVRISTEALSLAPSPAKAVQDLKDWLPGNDYIWVGHNLMLDFMFLRRADYPEEIRFNYRFLDLTTLIEVVAVRRGYVFDDYSLRGIARYFDIKVPETIKHSAELDVHLVHEVFKELMYYVCLE
jgi:DNA polymerase III epsilon subunit-like protein